MKNLSKSNYTTYDFGAGFYLAFLVTFTVTLFFVAVGA